MNCLRTSGEARHPLVLAKTDLVSAFRMLPIEGEHWRWLVFKARDPETGEVMYFVDKCLPFGASISCSHYQRFSNALKHIAEFLTGRAYSITNYLDDFLFVETSERRCNALVRSFLCMCEKLGIPVSEEKTKWGSVQIVFLGILLDGSNLILSIPEDKRIKALSMLQLFSNKRKATIGQLQELTGYLNFLCRVIFPGRSFTRRMYSKFSYTMGCKWKKFHHVRLDQEFKLDCQVWRTFLSTCDFQVICRPMIDIKKLESATEIGFFTDASGNKTLGFGGTYLDEWFFGSWEPDFIQDFRPSIAYLELYALTTGILIWSDRLRNRRITIHCDNKSVVEMINKTSSKCKNCMYLIRLLVLSGLLHNRRVFATYIESKRNDLADSLSRLDLRRFWDLIRVQGRTMKNNPSPLPRQIWPASKIWIP